MTVPAPDDIPSPPFQPIHRRQLPETAWKLARRWRALGDGPAGDDRPVLAVPGFLGHDLHMAVIRAHLARLGHDAHTWGLGLNRGNVGELLPALIHRADDLAQDAGGPVALVGWSLGGVLSREVARERPDLVRRVVTLGTPVVGGARHTAYARVFRDWFDTDLDAVAAQIEARHEVPIQSPVTAVYSRSDRVVQWQAARDPWTPGVEHVEVQASHAALCFHPDVLEVVAERVARP